MHVFEAFTTGAWRELAKSPWPMRRCSMARCNGQLYVAYPEEPLQRVPFGGPGLKSVGEVLALQEDGSWKCLRSCPFFPELLLAGETELFAFRGFQTRRGKHIPVAAYNVTQDRWRSLTSLPHTDGHRAGAWLRGKLYVAQWEMLQVLDPSEGRRAQWKRLRDLLTPRNDMALLAADGQLFAIGGTLPCDAKTSAVETYDPVNDSWSALPGLPSAQSVLAAAWLEDKMSPIASCLGHEDEDEVVG